MMQRMVAAHALAEATTREVNADRTDLFGRPRSVYSPTGDLDLCGVGAYGWRTASGYEGLTTLFWDLQGKRFLTATAARGEGQDRTFSIRSAYTNGIGWAGSGTAEGMCRMQFQLTNAKTNPDGRLSLVESCQATLGQPTNPAEVDFGELTISNWKDLTKIVRTSQPLGLRLADPRANLVILRPTQWGPRYFDELNQAFVWQLLDDAGSNVELRVPWTAVDETSVLFLESVLVERDQPTAILGRVELQQGAVSIYPLSLFSSGTPRGDLVLCPQFDQVRIRSQNEALLKQLREKHQRYQTVTTRIGDDEEEEGLDSSDDELAALPRVLRSLVSDVERILRSALEAGSARLSESARKTLAACQEQFEALGLAPLAGALAEVLAQPNAPDLLHAAYRLQLLRQSARLALF